MFSRYKPKTKADELKLTANILWIVGCVLTTNYVLSANDTWSWKIYPIVFLICCSIQYAVTKIESAIFSGTIPSPWSEKRSTKTTWIWLGAFIILLMDVIINLGGVGTIASFVKESASGEVLRNDYGATDYGLNLIKGFMIVALALLVAIGPELARMFAETLMPSPQFEEVQAVKWPQPEPEVQSDLDRALANVKLKRTEIPSINSRRIQ